MPLTAYIILLVARILVPLAQSGAVFNCSATKSEQPDNLTPLEISLFRNATRPDPRSQLLQDSILVHSPLPKSFSQVLGASPIHGPNSRPSKNANESASFFTDAQIFAV
jgi:hypothetical protein